jgi:hypothetical protein
MKVATGRVVGGKVVVEGSGLDEGTTVTIIARDDDTFELSLEEEAVLLAAMEAADRGESIAAEDLLKSIRRPA